MIQITKNTEGIWLDLWYDPENIEPCQDCRKHANFRFRPTPYQAAYTDATGLKFCLRHLIEYLTRFARNAEFTTEKLQQFLQENPEIALETE